MRFTNISVFLALSAVGIAAPSPAESEKTLYKVGTSPRHVLARGSGMKELHKVGTVSHLVARQSSGNSGSAGNSNFCSGPGVTCASCFGSNWTECPDGVDCYDKTNPQGESACPASSGGSSGGSSGSGSGNTGSAGGSDLCTGPGVTCASCFGSNWTECPDGVDCYDKTAPQGESACSASSGGSGSGSSGSGSGSGLIGAGTTAAPSPTSTGSGLGSLGGQISSSLPTEVSPSLSSSTSTSTTPALSPITTSGSGGNVIGAGGSNGASGLSVPKGLTVGAGVGAALIVAAALL